MTIIHDPENKQSFDGLYAVLSIDEKGNEGIVAHTVPGIGALPMVFGHIKSLEVLEPVLTMLTTKTSKKLRLVKFTGKEVIKTY